MEIVTKNAVRIVDRDYASALVVWRQDGTVQLIRSEEEPCWSSAPIRDLTKRSMIMGKTNDRCPLQTECERKCAFEGHKLD